VVIAGNDVEVAGLESLGRTFTLAFERPHLHLETVLLQESGAFHDFP
jgi:hypothetical protein